MFIAELGLPNFADYDLSSLRTGIMAGSPCPVEVMKRVVAEMGMDEVTICYGMTETSPVSTQTGADDDLDRRTSTVGQVHPHLEVKVVDPETGLTVPRGETGEFCTRGYSVMLGYWNEPEKTAEVIDRMHMADVTICYGMTETSPVSTQTGADDPLDKRVGTVGQVHPHVEVCVVDPETGEVVPRGATGELCTRGYSVMLGYWDEPKRTAEAIDDEGWMHTGDLATMDDEGYLNIVGRIKDMIIRGGENLYPREVEEYLYSHPDVADVQVIGVPDVRYGEELMAWVIPREGADLDEDALRDFCRGHVARQKIPRYVKLVDAFPMTVTGKVQKFKMREEAIEELGLQEAASVTTA